jgi:hypothetical protein
MRRTETHFTQIDIAVAQRRAEIYAEKNNGRGRIVDQTAVSKEAVVRCLRDSEKSFNDLFRCVPIRYNTLQRLITQLVKDGVIERRWVVSGSHRKYLYKLGESAAINIRLTYSPTDKFLAER